MNISVRQLRAFVRLAECRSFAEAAEQLHITQPALSVAIKNMEEDVGGALFYRSTRNLSLSAEGAQFYPVAKRLLADWEKAFDDLDRLFKLQQGRLSIAVMPSFAMNGFPDVLLPFQSDYPDINISVHDVVMEAVLDSVRQERTDIGITFEPDHLDGLKFIPLFSDQWIALVHKDSQLSQETELTWQQLVSEPFIAMNRGSWSRAITEKTMQKAKVQPSRLLEANQLATIGRMVASGLGVAVVPQLCQQQMEAMGIVCKPLLKQQISGTVGAFVKDTKPLSAPASAFLAHLQRYFAD